MVREFAIVPELFDLSHPDRPDAHFVVTELFRDLMQSGLLRVDEDEKWIEEVKDYLRDTKPDQLEKHIFKSVLGPSGGCLVPLGKMGSSGDPEQALDWMAFFRRSWSQKAFNGVVGVSDNMSGNPVVLHYRQLHDADWWVARCDSWQIKQSVEGYWGLVESIIHTTPYLVFVDPYFAPCKGRYKDFPKLMRKIANVNPSMEIVIHTVSEEGPDYSDSTWRRMDALHEMSAMFKNGLRLVLWNRSDLAGIKTERYLLSGSKSFSLSHAFAIQGGVSTVSLIGKQHRSEVDSCLARNRSSLTLYRHYRKKGSSEPQRFLDVNFRLFQ